MEKNKKGFTLIELLVVIGIITLLSTIVTAAVNEARKKAKIVAAQATLRQLRTAIEMLENDTGQWPKHHDIGYIGNSPSGGGVVNEIYDLNIGEAGLAQDDSITPYPNWRGPYIRNVPKDPWGNDYFYDSDYKIGGNDVNAIGSFGPHKNATDTYEADDIIVILKQ